MTNCGYCPAARAAYDRRHSWAIVVIARADASPAGAVPAAAQGELAVEIGENVSPDHPVQVKAQLHIEEKDTSRSPEKV